MSEKNPNSSSSKSRAATGDGADRMPTDEELLYELRKHGAKPPPPIDLPDISRRTRDFLLLAGIGSIVIGWVIMWLCGDAGLNTSVRIALTGIAAYCGILAYIFYGVMSRY